MYLQTALAYFNDVPDVDCSDWSVSNWFRRRHIGWRIDVPEGKVSWQEFRNLKLFRQIFRAEKELFF